MTYNLRANNKTYIVSDHAAQRMLERFISDELVIKTLENGHITEQPHGRDLYEHQIYDQILEIMVIVQVVVEEDVRIIVSVIDDTSEGK